MRSESTEPLRVRLVRASDTLHWYATRLFGSLVVLLLTVDAVVNNWSLNNFLGGGFFFLTPVGGIGAAYELDTEYSFGHGRAIANLSDVGYWMTNVSVSHLVTKSKHMYTFTAGEFALTPSTDLCPIFQGTYSALAGSSIRLALADDAISFYRGHAMDHFFTNDQTVNLATRGMSSADLFSLGYVPGRTSVDKRFTTPFTVANTSQLQHLVVPYFRIYTYNFCTGCTPITELGFSRCNLTLAYSDANQTLRVDSSAFVPGSTYKLGVTMANSVVGVVSLVAKLAAIMLGIAGFFASRRTVQWFEVDPSTPDSVIAKVLRTVAPKYFPFPSHALSYDMFCYNSDVFVFLYAFSVLLDLQNCLLYVGRINVYNAHVPQALPLLTTLSLSCRLLWVNCAILKVCKILWNLVVHAEYNGQSNVMTFFNFSSVTYLYLSAVLLFFIPAFVEYDNSVAMDLPKSVESLDGLRVEVVHGSYMRVAVSILYLLLLNVFAVTVIDHAINYKYWSTLRNNSLTRQTVYNSSSILCDYLPPLENHKDGVTTTTSIRARRLSTLQWFFMSHLTCFGLPAKDLYVKKKKTMLVKTARNLMAQSAEPTTAIEEEAAEELFTIVQDGDRVIHLLDGSFAGVGSAAFNTRVLRNAPMTIR
ncbi:hypothetical protein SPRG_16273 [Saprolegnia parasitica CBS 223.65]|uniref:Uncharacterized protein n=1 Tax=Saprolegnia parasitica (strain CBS 223.65) TaxID=695850 RepID=A0A067BIW1_SAPPC|nr:hypothetical protein SPRG_16273 [Saprolegnia parasitica CBS 223.65]KDO18354.1 hypothetical protein SPRG_16273 [Saprolegnia parasitica CBS 223.65]|eukprot:XP_012210936.1 hypothetical protein SPRG_16273 [Saprolegnia parasitica CBS 223.65]